MIVELFHLALKLVWLDGWIVCSIFCQLKQLQFVQYDIKSTKIICPISYKINRSNLIFLSNTKWTLTKWPKCMSILPKWWNVDKSGHTAWNAAVIELSKSSYLFSVNEALLTGEAVPETKTAIPRSNLEEIFDTREHQRHTLFRGTKVIQVSSHNYFKSSYWPCSRQFQKLATFLNLVQS